MPKLTDQEKADRAAARKAKHEEVIEAAVRRNLANAPPLTQEQIVNLRAIFAGRDVVIPKVKVVDTAGAARILKCGPRRVTRMRMDGRITGHKSGGRWWYAEKDLTWLRDSLERAARDERTLASAEMNELIDLLIHDRLHKGWNPS